MNILNKKLLVSSGIVALLTLSSATIYAKTTTEQPLASQKTQSSQAKEDDLMITQTSTPPKPVEQTLDPKSTNTPTSPSNAPTEPENTPQDDLTAVEQFEADVAAQVAPFANFFVPTYAPTVDAFIQNQLRCGGRGVDDETTQDVLDAKLSYFIPTSNDDGTLTYHFFSGGCQPVFMTR